jgi:tetratricopeptide (TPR) repeat protein
MTPKPPLAPSAPGRRLCLTAGLTLALALLLVGTGAGTPRAESPYGDFLAGRHAERVYDFGRAASLLGRALNHSPDNPALQRQAMHQMLAAGRFDDVVRVATRYLKHEPESVLAGLALVVDDLARGRIDAAVARLKPIPARGLGGYFVPLASAWVKVAQKRPPDEALAALAPLAKLRGGKSFHAYHAALIHDLGGNVAEARKLFDGLGESGYAGYSRMVAVAGAFYERAGDAARARAVYAAYLDRRPDNIIIEEAAARAGAGAPVPNPVAGAVEGAAEAMFNMATLLSQENVPEIAMMLVQMSLRLSPDFDDARILRGDILQGVSRHENAIAAYETVSRDSPQGWMARLRAAQLLDRIDKREVALARLRDMSVERRERADVMVAMGDLLRFAKRYPEAVDAYDAAFARIGTPGKRHWSLYYSRAVSLERAKRWKRAEADFLKALSFQPDQPLVLNYLGYSWVEQRRNLKQALEMIERAVRLRPNDGFIIDSLGWAHYQLGSFPRAVGYLERAVELTPQDPTINDHLGDAYWRVGRFYEARFQWQRALSLGPEPGDAAGIEKKLVHGLGGKDRKGVAAETGSSPHGG